MLPISLKFKFLRFFVNTLDIEIARFMQTSDLSFYFSGDDDKHAFAFRYFKNYAREQLSPKAYGRICQDLKLKNQQGFTRSYAAARKVIDSAIKMRYLVTTLSDQERVESMLAKFEKHRISVKRNIAPPAAVDALLKEFKMGVIFIPDASPETISSITMYYSFPAPAFLHLVRDTAAAWGFAGEFPKFVKNKLEKVTLELSDADSDQKEMIELGETKAMDSHPHLVKES